MRDSITCPDCSMTSFYPGDITNSYCANCHKTINQKENRNAIRQSNTSYPSGPQGRRNAIRYRAVFTNPIAATWTGPSSQPTIADYEIVPVPFDEENPDQIIPDTIKAWKFCLLRDDGKACAVNNQDPYDLIGVNTSRCLKTENHLGPMFTCSCGFHAFKKNQMRHKMQVGPFWIAEVELSGKIVEHEDGYRAEKQEIIALYDRPDSNGEIGKSKPYQSYYHSYHSYYSSYYSDETSSDYYSDETYASLSNKFGIEIRPFHYGLYEESDR